MADDFRRQQRLTSEVWVDLKKVTYRQLAFTRGREQVLNVRSALNAARALSKGNFQGSAQGLDSLQNGGVLVVNQRGACVYAFISAVAGDKPPTAGVLEIAVAAKA